MIATSWNPGWLIVLWLVSWVIGTILERLNGRSRVLQGGMVYASVFYHNAFVLAFTGALNLSSAVCRMMLLIGTSSTPDSPDHEFIDDIDADEATDGSYGRVTLTSKTVTDDDANNRAELDFADVVYAALAGTTIIMAALGIQTGGNDSSPEDDPLVCLWDIANTAPDGSDFTLQPGSEGAVHFT